MEEEAKSSRKKEPRIDPLDPIVFCTITQLVTNIDFEILRAVFQKTKNLIYYRDCDNLHSDGFTATFIKEIDTQYVGPKNFVNLSRFLFFLTDKTSCDYPLTKWTSKEEWFLLKGIFLYGTKNMNRLAKRMLPYLPIDQVQYKWKVTRKKLFKKWSLYYPEANDDDSNQPSSVMDRPPMDDLNRSNYSEEEDGNLPGIEDFDLQEREAIEAQASGEEEDRAQEREAIEAQASGEEEDRAQEREAIEAQASGEEEDKAQANEEEDQHYNKDKVTQMAILENKRVFDEKLYKKISKIAMTMTLRTVQNLAKDNEITNESLIYAIFAVCSESPMLNAQLTSVARCYSYLKGKIPYETIWNEFYQRKMICFAWLTLEEFIYQGLIESEYVKKQLQTFNIVPILGFRIYPQQPFAAY